MAGQPTDADEQPQSSLPDQLLLDPVERPKAPLDSRRGIADLTEDRVELHLEPAPAAAAAARAQSIMPLIIVVIIVILLIIVIHGPLRNLVEQMQPVPPLACSANIDIPYHLQDSPAVASDAIRLFDFRVPPLDVFPLIGADEWPAPVADRALFAAVAVLTMCCTHISPRHRTMYQPMSLKQTISFRQTDIRV
jgi:hypothetical protein